MECLLHKATVHADMQGHVSVSDKIFFNILISLKNIIQKIYQDLKITKSYNVLYPCIIVLCVWGKVKIHII